MRGVEVIPSAHQIHWWLGITASHMLFIIWRNFDVGCFLWQFNRSKSWRKYNAHKKTKGKTFVFRPTSNYQ
jgi:hypothetical protein